MVDAVQGFLASLELDETNITEQVTATPLTRAKTSLDKSVMDNTGQAQSIPGMQSGTLNISGYVSQAEYAGLEVTWAKSVPVSFTLTVLEGLTADQSWSGLVTLTAFDADPQGDDMWQFTLSGDTSGPVTFNPSTP